jgi:hypothetical protein
MGNIQISDDILEKLRLRANKQGVSIDELAEDLLIASLKNPLEAIVGMFDDDIEDASTTVRETMAEYYERKSRSSG